MIHTHAHSSPYSPDQPQDNSWLKRAAIGTALVTGAVILAPYLFPMMGLGETALAEEAMTAMHGTGLGNGLAGTINGVLNAIPLIGPTLSQGGLITAATSGVIGIGGMLLGNYIEKRQDGTEGIRWGKVLATAALATSALIALPSLLTSISVGIVYMAAAFSGVELASSAVAFMASTLGSVGSMSVTTTGLTGAAAALPHLVTCVAPAIPCAVSLGMLGSDDGNYSRQLSPTSPADPVNLKYSDGSITARIETDQPLRMGKPAQARVILTHADTGQPLTADELAVIHTEKLHLFVVDQSLKDYQHIHPQPTDEPGVYAFSFTPKTPYPYSAWADFQIASDGNEHRLRTLIPSTTNRSSPAFIIPANHGIQDGIQCEWEAHPPLQKGIASSVKLTLRDANGTPLTDLEPVMGAFIHMVGFSADGQSFIHTHPMEAEPTQPGQRGGPSFNFHVEPDTSGPVQFYVQIQRQGKETYIPVGQIVKQPSLLSEKFAGQSYNHTMSAGHMTI